MNQIEREYRNSMDGLQFSDASKERILNNLMEAEKEPANAKRFRAWRPALIAAAACLALVGAVFAAASATGFDLVTFFAPGEKVVTCPDGQKDEIVWEVLDEGTVYFPAAELPQAVHDAAASAGIDEHEVALNMNSWSEAEEFLGMELPFSPVLEERGRLEAHEFGYVGTQIEEYLCRVGLAKGLQWINVSARYELDGMHIMLTVMLKTDAIPDSSRGYPWLTAVRGEFGDPECEDYLAANGTEAVLIARALGDEQPGWYSYDAYFKMGGMICHLTANYNNDKDKAIALIKEVVDGF